MTEGKLPLTISELHDAFEEGSWTPLSITEFYLKRAKSNRLNAWLTLCEDRALSQARSLEKVLVEGGGKVPRETQPLFGVPMGIKDNIAVADVRMTCASRILENYIAPYSATVVRQLEDAGAITLGKLNLDEFAMGGSNENSAFGKVLHPTHPDRVPGGSSGGSAAAVAAQECLISLGSDTGGSIRLPASYCGVVGMKPTYGRVSRFGLVAFASSLDQIGPFAHTVKDTARVLQVISGFDQLEATSTASRKIQAQSLEAIKGLKVGLPTDLGFENASSGVKQAMTQVVGQLERAGVTVVPVELPHVRHAIAVYYVIAVSEASSNLSRFDGVRYGARTEAGSNASSLEGFHSQNRSLFGPEVKRRILLGTFSLSSGYSDEYFLRAAKVRHLIAQGISDAFSKVDFLLSPVSVSSAFKSGEKTQDPLQMYLNDLYTIPANLAGLPAISLPWTQDADALPVGIQIMAPQGRDESLLDFSQALETIRGRMG
jgi:aspartyl-tRNA(Asn)/glutamyl-tRNA(Gln) amidotransferase subunit A